MGGVLGNAAVIALIAVITLGSDTELAGTIMPGVVGAQMYMIVMNLLPRKGRTDGAIPSDGYLILWTLFHYRATKAHVAAVAAAYAARLKPYQRSDRPAALTATSARICYEIDRTSSAEDRREAADALLRELEHGKMQPSEETLVLDRLVTNQLVWADLGLESRLDEFSARALHLGPEIATLRGSRGAVLVELGRHTERRALLASLAIGPPSFDMILSQLFLACAAHGLGEAAEAHRRLEAARVAIDALPYVEAKVLLARIEAEIGAVPE